MQIKCLELYSVGSSIVCHGGLVSVNLIWRTSSITCTASPAEVHLELRKEGTLTRGGIAGKANAKSD
jgi:hypothetical protein